MTWLLKHMMRACLWMLRHLLRIFARQSWRLMRTPYGMMGMVLLGVVACSSDGMRNTWNSVTFSSGSPYGGTEDPVKVKLGKAYTIGGTTYRPYYDAEFTETGYASWYGPGFHGRKTASGERYDQFEMTAAHRTLPMPSMIRVTRRDTGASVIVRVNDRGPFAHGRVLDLSKAAAEALDMVEDGVAPIQITYLEQDTRAYLAAHHIPTPAYMKADEVQLAKAPVVRDVVGAPEPPIAEPSIANASDSLPEHYIPSASAQPMFDLLPDFDVIAYEEPDEPSSANTTLMNAQEPDAGAPSYFTIQTASFSRKDYADRHAREMALMSPATIQPVSNEQGVTYRVYLEPVAEYAQAIALLRQVHEMGYRDARIMVE